MTTQRDSETDRALATLVAVARRLEAAGRVSDSTSSEPLQAVAELAVAVLDSQAASIALHDPAADRLVFVAAWGPAAGAVVGIDIDAAAGIAGYAFTTGQPIAVAEATTDPRFDRTVAEATGYVPGSLLAVPLLDQFGSLGVLEALDRRGGAFTLRDLELAGSIAAQATAVVRAERRSRETGELLRAALVAVFAADGGAPDGATIDRLVTAATADLGADPEDPGWRLADRIARLRSVDPEGIELAIDWLDALLRRGGAGTAAQGRR